jgi:hypothetical protein
MAPTRSSDFLVPSAHCSGFPLQSAYRSLPVAEIRGPPRLLVRPFSDVPQFQTPSVAPSARPVSPTARLSSKQSHARDSGQSEIFGANSCGPPVCLPTHRRPRCRERRKTGSRPAGLSFGRTGISPAGRLSRFLRCYRMLSSLPTSIAWSHVKEFTSRHATHPRLTPSPPRPHPSPATRTTAFPRRRNRTP